MPNNAGEMTQVEYETKITAALGTLNNAGGETQVQAEADAPAIETTIQNEPTF
jgi:hypothetical protein